MTGHVRAGFRLVEAGVVVLGSHELFHKDLLPPESKAPPGKSSRRIESRAIDSFLDLNEGDFVVHVATASRASAACRCWKREPGVRRQESARTHERRSDRDSDS